MNGTIRHFIDFVEHSPTAYHAVENIAIMLEEAGFTPLNERDAWSIQPGSRCYVTRNRSSIIAFVVPEQGMSHFQITAAHSASPMFKLKPVAEIANDRYVRLNVEKYGGMLMAPWFDRPLSVAGRLLVRQGSRIEMRLTDLERDAVLIPNLPIHMNRDVNDGYKYNPQVDLLPVYGDGDAAGGLLRELAEKCEADPDQIVGSDLFVYNRMKGVLWGMHDEYFSCPRIDDLECAWAAATSLAGCEDPDAIAMCAIFDNEEVGSLTRQGADSTFLSDVMFRIGFALGAGEAEIRAAVAQSFMISADNAHAVHPNHPEKYDEGNRAYMNEGIVLKYNADQKYTTDGMSTAVFASLCEMAQVPVQTFANRSDMRGGSTLGNIANAHASMNTVDIGLAQLAMHSCYETAGTRDLDYLMQALDRFYATRVAFSEDGSCELW